MLRLSYKIIVIDLLYFMPWSSYPKCIRESSNQVTIIVYVYFIISLSLVSFRELD